MPTLSMFYGIMIQMFWNEHAPPHFHARYAHYKLTVNINTLEVIAAKMPRRAQNLVLEWALLHRDALLEDWALCQQKQAPKKIPPLR